MILLYEMLRVVKIIETESRMVVARGLEDGEQEPLFKGYRISALQDEGDGVMRSYKGVMKMDGSEGCTTL